MSAAAGSHTVPSLGAGARELGTRLPTRVKPILDSRLYVSSHPNKWRAYDHDRIPTLFDRVYTVAGELDHGLAQVAFSWQGSDYDFDYLHLKCSDGRMPDPNLASVVAPQVIEWLRQGHRVLVSCQAGRSRSCYVATLAVRDLCGLTGSAALEVVRHQRPLAVNQAAHEADLRALGEPE
jgi:protein-tyrosine phosphatase